MTDKKAAEEYLQAHGRAGGSSLATLDAFLAGCTHVRTSAEWKALNKVAERSLNLSVYVEGTAKIEHAGFAELGHALQELDRIRKDGESG